MDWFKNYLNQRKQYVCFKDTCSEINNIDCGVPQGSVLGPLLFILYSNDLPKAVSVCKTILFADDTTLFKTGSNKKQLFVDIKNDLTQLINWFRANKLSLNISKTNYVLFTPKRLKLNFDTSTDDDDNVLKFGQEIIEQKLVVKFLGLLIDEHLDWSHQSNHIMSKLASSLYIMNAVKNHMPLDSRKMIYYSFFYSHLTYGISLWGTNTSKWFLNRIIKQQKRAVKSIANGKSTSSHTFKEHSIINVTDLIYFEISKLLYQVSKKLIPIPIQNIFEPNNIQHTYNTRHGNDPRYDKQIHYSDLQKSFISTGPPHFSHLPKDLKEAPSFTSFINMYKKFILK